MNKSTDISIEDLFELLDINYCHNLRPADFQKIVDYTKACIGVTYAVTVEFDDILSGRGYFYKKIIVLPLWFLKYHIGYQIYYAIHELCHCIVGLEHDKAFKTMEDRLLNLWDIKIVRCKAYPKKLFMRSQEIKNIPYNNRRSCKSGDDRDQLMEAV